MARQSSGPSDETVSSSSYGAEEYLVRMLMMLKYEPNDIPKVANQTKGLLHSVMECLEGCRWELLQEAYVTLAKLIEKSIKSFPCETSPSGSLSQRLPLLYVLLNLQIPILSTAQQYTRSRRPC